MVHLNDHVPPNYYLKKYRVFGSKLCPELIQTQQDIVWTFRYRNIIKQVAQLGSRYYLIFKNQDSVLFFLVHFL